MVMVTGKMTVVRFEKEFKDSFGVFCDVLFDGELASNGATLASLRPKNFKGAKVGSFDVRGNMLVKNVKKNFKKEFGLDLEIYKTLIADDEDIFGNLHNNSGGNIWDLNKLKLSGGMTVKRFKASFEQALDIQVDLMDGNEVASDERRLNSLCLDVDTGQNSGEFRIKPDMLVGDVKKQFMSYLGLPLQLYKLEPALDITTISSLRKTQSDVVIEASISDLIASAKEKYGDNLEGFVVEESGGSDDDGSEDELKEREKEAEDSYDFHKLAEDVLESGNKEWAKKLYQKAIDCATDFRDMLSVVDSVADEDGLNDKGLAKKYYQQASDRADESVEFRVLGESILENLGDKEWAKEIFQKALDTKAFDASEEFSDHYDLGVAVANSDGFNDKAWAREIFQKALDKAEDFDDHHSLGVAVADEDCLNDKKWAREIFQSALIKAEDADDHCKLGEDIARQDSLDDKEWAKEVFQKALDKAEDFDDHYSLGVTVANEDYLNDKEWARKIFQSALIKAEGSDDYLMLGMFVASEHYLEDLVWARKIFDQALEKLSDAESVEQIQEAKSDLGMD